MSSLLKEKRALAKLREELEGRKGKLCRSCKGFGHLARNCRNGKEREKGGEMPQNKFEVLRSRVMQCGIEERIVRSMRTTVVKCFRCGEEGHKYRMCPKRGKRVARPRKKKAHQGERREVRRVEEEKAARPVKGEAQQERKRTSVEKLRIRAEVYCGKGVPEEAQLFELGWTTKEVVVSYLICEGCGERGCHVEDNKGQGVIPWARHKALNWCECKGRRVGGGVAQRGKGAAERRTVRRTGTRSKRGG